MGIIVLTLLLVTCSGNDRAVVDNNHISPQDIFLFVNFSDVSPGENRLPFALRLSDGGKIAVAPDRVTLTYALRDSGVTRTAPPAVFREWPVGGGVFTTTGTYDKAGIWDFNVTVQNPDGTMSTASATRLVKDVASTPAIGSPAPLVSTKTGSSSEELLHITSDVNPIPEMYGISLDEAVALGKPVMVTFSTPAWCTTKTCGPQVSTVDQVRQNHIGEASFIHVELFDNPEEMRKSGDPQVGVESPAIEPWNLPSEPWTFIIDEQGLIAAKFEAYTTVDELEAALVTVLTTN